MTLSSTLRRFTKRYLGYRYSILPFVYRYKGNKLDLTTVYSVRRTYLFIFEVSLIDGVFKDSFLRDGDIFISVLNAKEALKLAIIKRGINIKRDLRYAAADSSKPHSIRIPPWS